MVLNNIEPKKKLTFVSFVFLAYICLIGCDNRQTFLYIGFILLMGFTMLDLLNKTSEKFVFMYPCLWLTAFAFYCFISQMWAWMPILAVQSGRFLIIAAVFVNVMVNYFYKEKTVEPIILTIVWMGIAMSIYVIIKCGGFVQFYQEATKEGARIGGEITNVNIIGIYCSYAFTVLLYYLIYRKKKFVIPIMIMLFVVAMTSGSRKALLMLAVGVIVLLLYNQKSYSGLSKLLRFLLWITIIVVLYNFVIDMEIMTTIKERMDGLIATLSGDSGKADMSSLIRRKMIRIGIEQFKKTPFVGIGSGNSCVLNWRMMREFVYSHSEYIEMLINSGIVGFVMYYGVVLHLFRQHLKIIKNDGPSIVIISFVIMIEYLVMSIGSVNYYKDLTTYVYFILWISVVEIYKERKAKIKIAQIPKSAEG